MKGIIFIIIFIMFKLLAPVPARLNSGSLPIGTSFNLGPKAAMHHAPADYKIGSELSVTESEEFLEADLELEDWMMDPKQFMYWNNN